MGHGLRVTENPQAARVGFSPVNGPIPTLKTRLIMGRLRSGPLSGPAYCADANVGYAIDPHPHSPRMRRELDHGE
jgi:hypothetical protein